MIWPFRPRSPLSLIHKVSCERRFAEVARLLGRDRISRPAVLTPQDLDALIADCPTDELPQRLLSFVSSRLPVRKDQIRAEWGDSQSMQVGDSISVYAFCHSDDGTTVVKFRPELKEFPYRLAGVVSTAAAEYLIQQSDQTTACSPGTFEILPVFYGFGPVMANAALYELSEFGMDFQVSKTSAVGTVSSSEFGYCMALSDWFLATEYFDTLQWLRPDARETLRQGLKFLEKTDDCCFEKDFLHAETSDVTILATGRLQSQSSSMKLGTLYDLSRVQAPPSSLAELVAEHLHHTEPEIQRLAAIALGRFSELPRHIHDELLMLVQDAPAALRKAAITSLRPGFENDDQVIETLMPLLRKGDAATVRACVGTLLKYDDLPDDCSDSLMQGLACMVLTADSDHLKPGIELLKRTHTDATSAVQNYFADDPTALAIYMELLGEISSDA